MTPLLLSLLACRGEPELPPRSGNLDVPQALLINEVLSSNTGVWEDPDSAECPEFDDAIELYNAGIKPAELGEHVLEDGSGTRWTLPPGTLNPGDFVLLTADGEPEQGEYHGPFSVNKDGETLRIYRGANLIHTVHVPPMDPNLSWARFGDGELEWQTQKPSLGVPNEAPSNDPCLAPPDGFDDHSYPCIGTEEGFHTLAGGRVDLKIVKFDILNFQDPSTRHAAFLDTKFYKLHDEWYIFRMLNGQPVEGEDEYEPYPGNFVDIPAIYSWVETIDLESLFDRIFLRMTEGGRLTSSRYYNMALQLPRILGAGTIVYAPGKDGREDTWAFELEYADEGDYDDVRVYFEELEKALPAHITADLKWLTRSPHQIGIADQMKAEGLKYHDRTLTYADLATPGETSVYQPGTVAGTVHMVRAGEDGLEDSGPGDILVLDEIPDYLPPCAALITNVPQTELAHIALLAESRGIPNLYVAGITSDPQWDMWDRGGRSRVVMRATQDPDGMEAVAISPEDYAIYQASRTPIAPELPTADLETMPWVVDLTSHTTADLTELRPAVGGKSAGFLALLDADLDAPYAPLGITVKAYHAQLDLMDWPDLVLAHESFEVPGDPRIRYLILEGAEAYRVRYPGTDDTLALDDFLANDELADFVLAGGVRNEWLTTPIDAAILAEIRPALEAQFAALDASQGLRFRSSSNVEDIEGFNGAGLYASYSGFLDPDAAGDDRTIELALASAWSSYWGPEAFEERHASEIDHEAGGMAILVHPKFDDDYELSNGVITMTRNPDHLPDAWRMVVNSQIGAISVTNPPVDSCIPILPAVDEVVLPVGASEPEIERLVASTEKPDGDVLTDAQLLLLFDQVQDVVSRWLVMENDELPESWHRSTLTLDLEFREMASEWPAGLGASDDRLVIKQARSLEPSTNHFPDEVRLAPFPRDLLARASRVDRYVCTGDSIEVTAVEALTDPNQKPDMGASEGPFVAQLQLQGLVDLPELGWPIGHAVALDHLTMSHPFRSPSGELDTSIEGSDVNHVLLEGTTITISGPQGWELVDELSCVGEALYASPEGFLDGFF